MMAAFVERRCVPAGDPAWCMACRGRTSGLREHSANKGDPHPSHCIDPRCHHSGLCLNEYIEERSAEGHINLQIEAAPAPPAEDLAMTAWPLCHTAVPAYTCATFRLKRSTHARLLPCGHPRHHRGHHRVPADFIDRASADRRALAGHTFGPVQRRHPGWRDPGDHAGVLAAHLAVADALARSREPRLSA